MNRLAIIISGWMLCAFLGNGSIAVAQNGLPKVTADEDPPKISLEAEMEKGKSICRLILYIRNTTNKPFTFDTGARGGDGSLDDGFRFPETVEKKEIEEVKKRAIVGSAPTVLPIFYFSIHESNWIQIRPPVFSGYTRRSMKRSEFTVKPNTREIYASFQVPASQVTGAFNFVELEVPDHNLSTSKLKVIEVEEKE